MKNVLTIAGSDCSGGAGIQADLKTFSSLGTYGMSVITSVVAENTSRVISVHNVPVNIIKEQIDAVFEDITVDGIKIGMLNDIDTMKVVAEKLNQYKPVNVVVDPVMIAKGGHALMQKEALSSLKNEIIPFAYLLTPNIPEAEIIVGREINSIEDMKNAALKIHNMGSKNVLIKGGHLTGDAVDVLYMDGEFFTFTSKRINTKNTHGTGCTLSSAITAYIAKGHTVKDSVENAKNYVTKAIEHSLPIGKGNGPLNHFYNFFNLI